MPVIINDNQGRSVQSLVRAKKLSYDYPMNLKLVPGEPLHEYIVQQVMSRAQDSYNIMSNRYPQWNEIDEMLTAFIQPTKDDKEAIRKNPQKPVSIVVPQSYATMEILLTYMTSALLEDSIFRFEGRSPEDIVGAILLEKIVDMQMYFTKSPLALHTCYRDAFAYGFGLGAPQWITEKSLVMKKMAKPPGMLDKLLSRDPGFEKREVEELSFEGNSISNIDPYLALPDCNVPINRIQDGEFFGWVDRTNYKSLLLNEKNDESYFNVTYLEDIQGNSGTSRLYRSDASGRGKRSGIPDYSPVTSSTSTRMDVIKMFIDIIPRNWKLPGGVNNRDGRYPETWYFEVAADTVVLRCQRLGLNHGRKPIVAFAPDYDGYSISPISRMEIIQGLQKVTNFLFNSHITNVRKAINDMLIVDPTMIDIRGLKDPEPGKLLYMRKGMWGKGVEGAVKQLKVEDITRANMQDAQIIAQYTKDISGATDSLSGVRRKTSERVTAQEDQGDRRSSYSRLEKIAKLCSWMGMHDLGYMIASHTQQFMSQETYVKITGKWQDVLTKEFNVEMQNNRMSVSPFDILIAYDIIVRDGTIPGSNFSQVWVQMLPQLSQNQELLRRFDLVRIVKHIMRNAGAKDVDQFDRMATGQQMPMVNAQVQPDEQVARQVEAGDLIPAMEGANGSAS